MIADTYTPTRIVCNNGGGIVNGMHNPNVIVKNQAAQDAALKLARGAFQVGLLTGRECYSLASLGGTAKSYESRYRVSRDHLFSRIRAAGIPISTQIGHHNKIIIVIG